MNASTESSVVKEKQRNKHRGSSPLSSMKALTASKTYVVSGVEEITKSPHTLALLVLLIFACIIQFVLDVLSDVFHVTSGFPIVPVVAMSCGLTFFCFLVQVALGTQLIPQFHMFAPLRGGDRFCAMHLSGYALSVVSILLKLLLVMEFSKTKPRYGGMTIFAIMTISGHFLLTTSLLFFVMPHSVRGSTLSSTSCSTEKHADPYSSRGSSESILSTLPHTDGAPSHGRRISDAIGRLLSPVVCPPLPSVTGSTHQKDMTSGNPSLIASSGDITGEMWQVWDIALTTSLFASLLLSTSLTQSWSSSRLAATIYMSNLLMFLCVGFFTLHRQGLRLQLRVNALSRSTCLPASGEKPPTGSAAGEGVPSDRSLHEAEDEAQAGGERVEGSNSVCSPPSPIYFPFRVWTSSLVGGMAQVWGHLFLLLVIFSLVRTFSIGLLEDGAVIWKFISAFFATVCLGVHGVLLYLSGRQHQGPSSVAVASSSRVSCSSFSKILKEESMRVPLLITISAGFLYWMEQALHGVKLYFYYVQWKSLQPARSERVPFSFSEVFSVLLSFLSHSSPLDAVTSTGIFSLQALLALLLFLLPPLTHCQGRLVWGRAFFLWNPFGGNREFLIAQTIGWSSFSSAGLMVLLQASYPQRINFFFISSFLLFAQVCIFVSLRCFHTSNSTSEFRLASRKLKEYSHAALVGMSRSQRSSLAMRTVFNGELFLSLLFAVASFILRSICDVWVHLMIRSRIPTCKGHISCLMDEKGAAVPTLTDFPEEVTSQFPHSFFSPELLLPLANVLAFFSIPLAQLSMRHHVRLFFDLDQRSTGYVLLVAIGWTLYGLASISCFMNFFMGRMFQFPFSFFSNSYLSPTASSAVDSLEKSYEDHIGDPPLSNPLHTDRFFLYYTCQGLIFFVPLVLLISGFTVEIDSVLRSLLKKGRLEKALQELRKWGETEIGQAKATFLPPRVLRGEEKGKEILAEAKSGNTAAWKSVPSMGGARGAVEVAHEQERALDGKDVPFLTKPTHDVDEVEGSAIPVFPSEKTKAFYDLLDHLRSEVLAGLVQSDELHLSEEGTRDKRDGSLACAPSTSGSHAYEWKDVDSVMDAAFYITILTCLGSGSVLLLAAVLVERKVPPLFPFTFAITGLLVMTFSCVILQYSYGHRLHDRPFATDTATTSLSSFPNGRRAMRAGASKYGSRASCTHYQFFMPFRGGGVFVFLQGVGWSAFTFCWFFMLAMILEGRVMTGSFLALGFFTVVAQVGIMLSIGYFDGSASVTNVYLAQNPEGLLAAATIIGTFCCSRIYDRAMASHAATFSASATSVRMPEPSGWRESGGASPVSVLLSSFSFCIAVPIGILAIQRQRDASYFPSLFTHSRRGVGAKKKMAGLHDSHHTEERTTGGGFSSQSATAPNEEEEEDMLIPEDWAEDTMDEEVSNSLEGKPMQHAIWQAFFPSTARKGLSSSSSVSHAGTAIHSTALAFPVIEKGTDIPKSGEGALVDDKSQPAGILSTEEGSTSSSKVAKASSVHQRRRLYDFVSSLSRILAIFLVYLIPFIFFYLAYTHHFQLPTFEYGVVALEGVGVSLSLLLFLPTALPFFFGGTHPTKNIVWYTMCAWFLWSISTVVVTYGLSSPFFFRPCPGWLWFSNLTLVSCLSVIPYLQLTAFIMNTSFLGYFFHYYGYRCWYTKENPFITRHAAFDFFTGFFWIWYCTRFFGKPHLTGRAYRPRARAFLRNTIFHGSALYFNLKVIKVKPYVLEEEKPYLEERERHNPPSVDRTNPSNQYLFSFHPHGVFPGTSLYGPCTKFWEDEVGRNDTSIVTTHAADVIFSVPILREIPLLVGAMSVSRRAIERSIRNGNSPLIITGGQSEMLLTKWSKTELHLVCHHLGFIKIALKHNIPIVPVISFSECNIMENVHVLRLQRWFLKMLGFPLVVVPHGFWYLPLPTHLPLALVVGQPLLPYPGRNNPEDPSCVEELRARYFNHLQTIFYQYRAEAGYPDMVLYLHNGVYDRGIRVPPPGEKQD